MFAILIQLLKSRKYLLSQKNNIDIFLVNCYIIYDIFKFLVNINWCSGHGSCYRYGTNLDEHKCCCSNGMIQIMFKCIQLVLFRDVYMTKLRSFYGVINIIIIYYGTVSINVCNKNCRTGFICEYISLWLWVYSCLVKIILKLHVSIFLFLIWWWSELMNMW
jgi:hypothetical protein